MRMEVFANGFDISQELQPYAELRVWLAIQRAADRVSWVGVRLMPDDNHAADGRVVCQLEAWLRGIGLITVRHADIDLYVAIDCAAVRRVPAVVRKLRETGIYRPAPGRRTAPSLGRAGAMHQAPRLGDAPAGKFDLDEVRSLRRESLRLCAGLHG